MRRSAFGNDAFPGCHSTLSNDQPGVLYFFHVTMRAIQSSFPRLGDKFPFEKRGERRISMKMIILLYNLRARLVGINQIRNFFMPALNQNAEQYM
jgi:hypothetical protein